MWQEKVRLRYGIPCIGDRVAPRCVFADSLVVVVLRGNRATPEKRVLMESHGLLDLTKTLSEHRIDVLVCGGISREEREFLAVRRLEIVENVAGSVHELLSALQRGVLRSGFGLAGASGDFQKMEAHPVLKINEGWTDTRVGATDCLACDYKKCLQGELCELAGSALFSPTADRETERILEASLDISSEEDRTLCRLSELIYFCLEMRYQHIGVAYCIDLQEPAEILVRVLRRFFQVYPVSCKIGGMVFSTDLTGPPGGEESKSVPSIACNPRGQAEVLNRLGTDMNVIVGICIGADCIFSRFSDAPVTTLFVKDRSLANNPIGAVYSDYYLKEAMQTTVALKHPQISIQQDHQFRER